MSSGHGCFPPKVSTSASPNVFVNGIALHRQGDAWAVHCCGPSCHGSTLASGSSSVFANSKDVSRIGDPISCGDVVAAGSTNVFAGG